MNPFDLYGPQFLFFYIVLTAVVILVARLVRRSGEMEPGSYGASPLTDPYSIAYLRGGKPELVRVAVVSLVDRGLLSVQHDRLQTTAIGRSAGARKEIEKEVLTLCIAAREPKELFESAAFDWAAAKYETELEKMRLLPDDEAKARRRTLYMGAVAVLAFFAVTKILVALVRGRTNVILLIILATLALIFSWKAIHARRTARGDAFLSEVRNVFHSLKLRAPQIRPGGATTELAMLAAVFGVSALPLEHYPWRQRLFPRASAAADSSSGSSSSSCGSSRGSSCGSSCGGGCGGGCGGCGG
ncbi:MAG TPA: TIGR04222 domain-containing membrane protein [Thermoanaerobaculia bacterium]|nr:TIGR04222 domain-containing membrane protein [Thermoanaerobaculia bacterium]